MLISIGKAAKKLGVHPETIRRWERNGKIKSVRTFGGHKRFETDNLNIEEK